MSPKTSIGTRTDFWIPDGDRVRDPGTKEDWNKEKFQLNSQNNNNK